MTLEDRVRELVKKWTPEIEKVLIREERTGRYGWVQFRGLKKLKDELLALLEETPT
jgi:hypothetical protein